MFSQEFACNGTGAYALLSCTYPVVLWEGGTVSVRSREPWQEEHRLKMAPVSCETAGCEELNQSACAVWVAILSLGMWSGKHQGAAVLLWPCKVPAICPWDSAPPSATQVTAYVTYIKKYIWFQLWDCIMVSMSLTVFTVPWRTFLFQTLCSWSQKEFCMANDVLLHVLHAFHTGLEMMCSTSKCLEMGLASISFGWWSSILWTSW